MLPEAAAPALTVEPLGLGRGGRGKGRGGRGAGLLYADAATTAAQEQARLEQQQRTADEIARHHEQELRLAAKAEAEMVHMRQQQEQASKAAEARAAGAAAEAEVAEAAGRPRKKRSGRRRGRASPVEQPTSVFEPYPEDSGDEAAGETGHRALLGGQRHDRIAFVSPSPGCGNGRIQFVGGAIKLAAAALAEATLLSGLDALLECAGREAPLWEGGRKTPP